MRTIVQKTRAAARLGEELFHREWVADDARSPGGDGLGPVYNETSCVACHNLGGAGGAGPSNKNIVILSVIGRMRRGQSVPLHDRSAGHPRFREIARPGSMFAFVRSENERLAKQSGDAARRFNPKERPCRDA